MENNKTIVAALNGVRRQTVTRLGYNRDDVKMYG
jgi:hypothetical protein